uniref:Microtubule-associated protein Jupiter n=1 Tax=Anopheles atroparvus TaxID=41427 RepID=A0AAG5D4Q9_ANOAO
MSTSFNVGVGGDAKPSSRVLKPPGGGHSDIFGSSDVRHNPPRPKNNQQNSSNMNAVMGTVDPNETFESSKGGGGAPSSDDASSSPSIPQNGGGLPNGGAENKAAGSDVQRARVPPGGHSQGFW